jgi:hypothetical protein
LIDDNGGSGVDDGSDDYGDGSDDNGDDYDNAVSICLMNMCAL